LRELSTSLRFMMTTAKLDDIYKLGSAEPHESACTFDKVFARDLKAGSPQLCIASSGNQIDLLETLLEHMPEPMWLLYVLVVPRGEGGNGRYQSTEPQSRQEIQAFLGRFRNYLEADGRHNIWLKSEKGPALLVFDRHNLIYAYGPIDEWAKALLELGWSEVERKAISLPDPHSHHYHAIFDDDAREVLSYMQWQHSPLREQDQ